MKKFLASLLSLTILCSSVAVFCSAEVDQSTTISCPKGQKFNGTECVEEKNATETVNASKEDKTPAQSATSSEAKTEKFDLSNLKDIFNNGIANGIAFVKSHPKEIAIGGIATAAVATIYIFRNEFKDLAKKAGTSMKKAVNSLKEAFENKNNQMKTVNV